MQPMKCISCREEIRLAVVNRHLKKDRILLLCKTCAGSCMHDGHWNEITGMPWNQGKTVQCLGCDHKITTVFVNRDLPTVMGFCGPCHYKLTQQHLWEECRRVGDDPYIYTPDTITR